MIRSILIIDSTVENTSHRSIIIRNHLYYKPYSYTVKSTVPHLSQKYHHPFGVINAVIPIIITSLIVTLLRALSLTSHRSIIIHLAVIPIITSLIVILLRALNVCPSPLTEVSSSTPCNHSSQISSKCPVRCLLLEHMVSQLWIY